MRECESVTGMVLLCAPSGEYDRRLVLLTRERGKITAFAHGARRPGSPLMAASRTFAFGVFSIYEGRTAYTLQSAQISEYFEELSLDVEAACFGSYFFGNGSLPVTGKYGWHRALKAGVCILEGSSQGIHSQPPGTESF